MIGYLRVNDRKSELMRREKKKKKKNRRKGVFKNRLNQSINQLFLVHICIVNY